MNQGIQQALVRVMPFAVKSGLFVSVCSVSQPSGNLDNYAGAPDANYVPVTGLQNIQCMLAPPSLAHNSSVEEKTEHDVTSFQFRHCLLSGWYPILQTQTDWQATVDGVIYDIIGAESDSQSQMTRLSLRVVSH